MSEYVVSKSSLSGEALVPPSKSQTLRAILFGALATGKTTISNYLPSSDTQAMIEACRLLGATITETPTQLTIQGVAGTITHAEDVINAGNSGIVLRFCSAVGALSRHPVVVTGDHSIRHRRPITPLLEGLKQLGVATATMRGDGLAPVIIQGPIRAGHAIINGEDSQPVSALLIASALSPGPITLEVENPGEIPWVALTLHWFDKLGIPYSHEGYSRYRLQGSARFAGFDYTVPADCSSAAFPLAAALVSQSAITLKNIDLEDPQGDKELFTLFQQMGAKIHYDAANKTLHVEQGAKLSAVSVDINRFVDAITILAVVACYAQGETRIENAAVARHKECNRIEALVTELTKMGTDITATEDGLIIRGSTLRGVPLHSYHDHRMAMSLAVAALGAQGPSTISPVDCVSKTFPNFVTTMKTIGALIEERR